MEIGKEIRAAYVQWFARMPVAALLDKQLGTRFIHCEPLKMYKYHCGMHAYPNFLFITIYLLQLVAMAPKPRAQTNKISAYINPDAGIPSSVSFSFLGQFFVVGGPDIFCIPFLSFPSLRRPVID